MKNSILFLAFVWCVIQIASCKSDQTKKADLSATSASTGKVLILAVDGGGVKGIVPAIFLDSIESKTKKQSYELFDIIGGTSTGGIIALGLTTLDTTNNGQLPYTAEALTEIYQSDGSYLFVKQNCVIEHCAEYYASYKGQGIEPYLQQKFTSTTTLKEAASIVSKLENARTKQVFTTTYIVNSTEEVVPNPVLGKDYGPYLFNWVDADKDPTENYFVWEAARGTSAAPTYFPIANVGGKVNSATEPKWVVDGGMMSNDPVVWAIAEAFRLGLASSIEDIIVVSLGTGFYPGDSGVGINNNHTGTDDIPKDGNWNYFPWIISKMYNLEGNKNDGGTILDVVLDAVQIASDLQLQMLQKSGLTYYRMEPTLTAAQSQMDNISPENINSLIDSTHSYLASPVGQSILDSIVIALNAYSTVR